MTAAVSELAVAQQRIADLELGCRYESDVAAQALAELTTTRTELQQLQALLATYATHELDVESSTYHDCYDKIMALGREYHRTALRNSTQTDA